MASAFSKAPVVFLAVGLLLACGGEDPSPADGAAGSPGVSGSGGVATAGASSGVAGSAGVAGGVAAGGGGNGSAGAGGGSAGAGGAGPSGGAGGSAGQSQGGAGGTTGGGGAGGMAGAGGAAVAFALTSPAFEHVETCTQQNHTPCKLFPKTNEMTTIGGDNMSPELNWGPGPTGTMSYVITLHDFSNNFTHWAIWNIPAGTLQLPANLARQSKPAVPAGSQQMSFDNNNAGFGFMGPGADDHIYEFRLYALKVATFTPKTATDQGKVYDELEADAGKVVLGKTMLRGRSKKY